MQMKKQTHKETTNEGKARRGRKASEQASDRVAGRESGLVDSALALGMEDHAARLAAARSEQERAEITLGLQQAYGNAYVQRLVQAKLTVSQPGDVYEQEADRVAAEVTRGAGEQAQRQETPEDEEEIQAKLAADVQRQEDEEEVMMKVDDNGGLQVSEGVETRIAGARSGGEPLAETARAEMEPGIGADFSGVRVHTDAAADRLARDLSAEAFTTGQDVFFRSGTYQPETGPGKSLIAHELTHVVQQQAAPAVQRDAVPSAEEEEQMMANLEEEMEREAAEGPAAVPAGPNAAEQAPSEAAVPAQNAAEQVASAPTAAESAPAVPAPSAVEQAPSVNVAGPSTTQEVAGPAASTSTAVESATATAPEATGAESARQAALRGVWDSVFVANLRGASEAASAGEWATAKQSLNNAGPVLTSIMDAYRDAQPEAFIAMQELRIEMGILWEETAALSGDLPRAEQTVEHYGRIAPLIDRVGGML